MSAQGKSKAWLWHGPLVMLATFITIFSTIVILAKDDSFQARRAELRNDGESLSNSLQLRLKGNEDYLQMLAQDRADGSLSARQFQERASSYVREHPEIINITWVDAAFTIRDVSPLEGNKQILGLHLDLPEPKRASRQARQTRLPAYTRPFEAIQGKPSFEVWVPVFKEDQFLGLFAGVYSCQKTLEALVSPHISASHYVSMRDTSQGILSELPEAGPVDSKLTFTTLLPPMESGLVLHLDAYRKKNQELFLLVLESICLLLVLGMCSVIWNLKCEVSTRKQIECKLQTQAARLGEELAEREIVQETLQDQTSVLEGEIEERRRVEEALQQSETSVRHRLKAILEPDGDISTLELSDIIDCEALQSMLEDFYQLTGMLGAVLDVSGKVLVAVGWQDICTKFHRCHPDTLRNCLESDTMLTCGVPVGSFKDYRCKNNLWDMVTPLEIGGKHVGNIFIGQFFYEDEVPDLEYFRAQARRYGFDEAEYLAALDRVPRFSRERAKAGMQFYAKLTQMISTLSFSSIMLSRTLHERLQLEEQLRQAQKMEAVGQFAGGVAHDFNNILQVIIGYGGLLGIDDTLDDRHKEEIAQILTSAEKASQLTRGLLAFSRKQVFSLKPISLNEVIDNFKKFLVRILGEDIQLKTVNHRNNLVIYADVGQMEQVLINLASNARDAMQKGGLLTIKTDSQEVDGPIDQVSRDVMPGRYAVLTVSDSGCGMDEISRQRIFEPFYTTKEVGKGTGLGLAIVYGIVKQHNGFINVYSEPGLGSTFRIYLPIHISEQTDSEANIEPVPQPQGGGETILLAEDDADVRTLVVTVLAGYGYKVIQAVDGEDAIAKFAANSDISLVLMDMIMPQMDGKTASDEISRLRPGVKILYSSGYTADFIQKRCAFEKEIELVMKPVQPMELLRRVRAILDA
jgi:polar amino acid transport system substrate-binding protein